MIAHTLSLVGLGVLVALSCRAGETQPPSEPATARASPTLAQGIVVPKRSALIAGLDHSFKQRANRTQSQQRPNGVDQPPVPLRVPTRLVPNLLWFAAQRRQQQLQQQQQTSTSTSTHQSSAASETPRLPAVLNRQQQEILAANPTLAAGPLLTRSDAPSQPAAQPELPSRPAASAKQAQTGVAGSEASPTVGGQTEPAQYRGYSLIELEVRSDADRRFVQDLYGNLSAALNEQGSHQSSAAGSMSALSPYVDIDFWSFQPAADHVDIMVSPKSRSFVLNQLGRAKIRHRTRIDDIQSRLDQQLATPSVQTQLGAGSGQLSGRAGQPQSRQEPVAAEQLTGSRSDANASGSGEGPSPALNDTLFFENYQRLADINQYLERLVERNRDVARVQVIGRSSQGRYLRVLKLGYDQQDVDGSTGGSLSAGLRGAEQDDGAVGRLAPANGTHILESFFQRQESVHKLGSIWLDGGTHAREWISPATALYLSFRLADNHERCAKFFDTMRALVLGGQHQQQLILRRLYASSSALGRRLRAARSYPAPSSHSATLDAELVSGINEINSSLLGRPASQPRARTELEHTLELLAKSAQDVASEYACDLELDRLLRRYTFYVMPVLNPDGYEYSHTHNRLWRKTRSTSNHPIYRHFCLGADPNRNYDARHGATGSSSHPCSQTYGGSVPFTEPETRHQSNFVYANRFGMRMFISLHSYSQMILLPYSHSKQLAPDHKDLESVGLAAVKAIERTHGTVYRVGPSASILYTASGTASDWAYEKAGIKYSYTIELRDTGTYGFLLPRQQIVPTGEETFNGLLAMIEQMEKNDNLLTSKSLGRHSDTRANSTLADRNHVPDELSQANQRPPLENALDGSDSWATPQPVPSGVRDRLAAQLGPAAGAAPIWDAAFSAHRLDDEPTGDEPEPDSGYAFEGEGELMEPTRENIIEAAKMSEAKLTGRLDHTRRIVQAAGLTSSGRNYINSPLLASRTTPAIPRRESSDDLVTEKLTA